MSQVYIGYDEYRVKDVDDEFIHFVFSVVIGMVKLPAELEAGLILTNDKRMRELNSKYRGKDKPANILSFAYGETKEMFPNMTNDNYLGDIYISYPQLIAKARKNRVSERDEFVRLFVHGLLHLAGIHHDSKTEALKMEKMEGAIVAEICSF